MYFEIVGEIRSVEVIAVGSAIREIDRLVEAYGAGRWRKLKGVANGRLQEITVLLAERHWYEAHGARRREFKIKRFLT